MRAARLSRERARRSGLSARGLGAAVAAVAVAAVAIVAGEAGCGAPSAAVAGHRDAPADARASAGREAPPPTFVVTPTPGTRIDVQVGDGLAVDPAELGRWVARAADGIVGYFGSFPVPALRLELRPTGGDAVGFGTAYGGVAPWVFVELGRHTSVRALDDDWVLVHELIHEAFPHLDERHRWAMEGMATWVEPFIRLRSGVLAREALWARFVERMPFGLPATGDAGLDHTATWGRTYWGGALFWMMAEVAVRERTGREKGLRDAFRAIVAAGGTKQHMWTMEETLAAGDAALGLDVLSAAWQAWRADPVAVDLPGLWARLGVAAGDAGVTLDDAAPDAALRLAIERQAW